MGFVRRHPHDYLRNSPLASSKHASNTLRYPETLIPMAAIRRWIHRTKRRIAVVAEILRHPETPWYARLVGFMVVAYAASPLDLIPDFIPVLGYLDDVILIPLGIVMVVRLTPKAIRTEAVKAVAVNHEVDLDDIKLEKKEGGSLEESKLIKGILVDKEVLHSGMPTRVENAKIALINAALEIEKTETSAEIRISSPDQLQAFMDEEDKMLKKIADTIKASGANVIFCQKGIDDLVSHYLAKEKIVTKEPLKDVAAGVAGIFGDIVKAGGSITGKMRNGKKQSFTKSQGTDPAGK